MTTTNTSQRRSGSRATSSSRPGARERTAAPRRGLPRLPAVLAVLAAGLLAVLALFVVIPGVAVFTRPSGSASPPDARANVRGSPAAPVEVEEWADFQ